MTAKQKPSSAFGKMELLYSFVLGGSAGIAAASAIDLFSLSYLNRYPYRFPFDRIMLVFAVAGFLLALVFFVVHLIRKSVPWSRRLAYLVMEVFLVGGLAVIITLLWWFCILTVHDVKRAVFPPY